jgi:hypothetical protein
LAASQAYFWQNLHAQAENLSQPGVVDILTEQVIQVAFHGTLFQAADRAAWFAAGFKQVVSGKLCIRASYYHGSSLDK